MLAIVIRLRDARYRAGLTQAEASAASGVGVKSISSFESGSRLASLKVSQLLRLLDAYGMTPSEFFSDSYEIHPHLDDFRVPPFI